MKLNKNASYVLLHLLSGDASASVIGTHMPELEVRSIQRALTRLVELGLATRHGARNNPTYHVAFPALINAQISQKLLVDERRPETGFHHELLDWLEQTSPEVLGELLGIAAGIDHGVGEPQRLTPKELEYLTIELSWKS